MQEAACRGVLPPGASVRVISDSGGQQSRFSAARDGYQALLAAIAAGEVATIVVNDLSRRARNTSLMLNLLRELERRQVPLLVANLPGAKFDRTTGRDLFGPENGTAANYRAFPTAPLSVLANWIPSAQ